MTRLLTLLLASITLLPASPAQEAGRSSGASQSTHPEERGQQLPNQPAQIPAAANAQAKAYAGKYQLHLGHIHDAEAQCKEALATDPANKTAMECLELAASMAIDEQLNHADNLILDGKSAEAATIAANLVHSRATPKQRCLARLILRKASPSAFSRVWAAIPEWIRQIIITLLFIVVGATVVRALRRIWTAIQINKMFPRKTIWNLLPLREAPGSTDGEKATDGLLDAIARLGDQFDRDPWKPRLLLLRPTPPAMYDPGCDQRLSL